MPELTRDEFLRLLAEQQALPPERLGVDSGGMQPSSSVPLQPSMPQPPPGIVPLEPKDMVLRGILRPQGVEPRGQASLMNRIVAGTAFDANVVLGPQIGGAEMFIPFPPFRWRQIRDRIKSIVEERRIKKVCDLISQLSSGDPATRASARDLLAEIARKNKALLDAALKNCPPSDPEGRASVANILTTVAYETEVAGKARGAWDLLFPFIEYGRGTGASGVVFKKWAVTDLLDNPDLAHKLIEAVNLLLRYYEHNPNADALEWLANLKAALNNLLEAHELGSADEDKAAEDVVRTLRSIPPGIVPPSR